MSRAGGRTLLFEGLSSWAGADDERGEEDVDMGEERKGRTVEGTGWVKRDEKKRKNNRKKEATSYGILYCGSMGLIDRVNATASSTNGLRVRDAVDGLCSRGGPSCPLFGRIWHRWLILARPAREPLGPSR